MPAPSLPTHYSIGDVLAMLQPEFPDVTVSKIRFLESQGLVTPERTASGYRKFYEPDVERLRFILKQQKDNFLPLKVIKDRLVGVFESADQETLTSSDDSTAAKSISSDAVDGVFIAATNGANVSKEELSTATGLPIAQIDELERYGFITPHRVAGIPYYDDDAHYVARLTASFARHGVEPKQLRVYKNSAEREVAMFEQLVSASLRSPRPEIRKEAMAILSDFALLGGEFRAAMVRQTLRELLGG